MLAAEFRRRVDRLGITYAEAAKRLGLSLSGLQHNLRGERPIGRQTELLLECLEHHCTAAPRTVPGQGQLPLEPSSNRLRRRLFAILIVVAATMSVSMEARAGATAETGNKLYESCIAPSSFDRGPCYGYAVGIVDVMSENPINGFSACIPNHVTIGQIRDLVTQYLTTNSARRHLTAAGLVAAAQPELTFDRD